jgi:mannose-6-phosphate isomerase-like protein (cupin superfamily)
MSALEKGITASGTGYAGKQWNILGQVYYPKATCDAAFAFETNSLPAQFVPVHVHPTQDEFILMQEGVLDLKLDGVWVQAKVGDLVRMPRGIPHGYFNKSDKPARRNNSGILRMSEYAHRVIGSSPISITHARSGTH